MATSHLCNGKWVDGPVSGCPKHKQLAKRQATVHRGAGTPGGFKSAPSSSESSGSGSSSGGSSGGE